MKLIHSARLNAALIVLLIAALVVIAMLYPRATRPLAFDHDQALIERATGQAAELNKERREDVTRQTFPIVMHLVDRSCVELRSTRSDGAGTYTVCYERQSGNFIEERLQGGF